MFGPSPSPFQNSKDAALMQSGANLQQPNVKSDFDVPLYGQGNRSSSSLDVLASKAGNANLPKGLAQQINALFAPVVDTSTAGYGGSTAGYGGGTTTPTPRHFNQGIGNGSEGGDPGKSAPHGGSNDETGRTPGQRWFPKLF